ncbi:MAG: sigma 54-interacting transcriptional regulator, partial [Deltaproteobacteria bacterium]
PGVDGLELLAAVRRQRPDVPVIVMTAEPTLETAVQALRRGAYDYLDKVSHTPDETVAAVRRALEWRRLFVRNRYLERQVELTTRVRGFIGESPALRSTLATIDSAAGTDASVLILGESGTGKELVARALHERSTRSPKPFIAVNCSALTETLLESELFGHVKGSFSGATSDRTGLFEAASGGTLFLDEVGELSAATQARLLRVLQEREIRPVGSSKSRPVDIRVVAATHRNLVAAVTAGQFREDLYYRLRVVTIEVPPLRARSTDIPLLAQHFLALHAQRHRRAVTDISSDAMERLLSYAWPGNVRELENAIEQGVVLARGVAVTAEVLPREIAGAAEVREARVPGQGVLAAILGPVASQGAQDESLDLAAAILGSSSVIRTVREQLRRIAAFRDVPVLVQGEAGTGKLLVAETVHRLGGADRPFVTVRCAEIQEDVLESELFGHERPSASGGRTTHVGLLESAADGTILLDDVGAISVSFQPKLLRALESRSFRRVGGTQLVELRARIVSTVTQADQRLRPDLQYRLASFTLILPPLRERAEDIELLAEHFLGEFGGRHGAGPSAVSPAAMDQLRRNSWDGNVRELRAVIERAAILATGIAIEPADIAASGFERRPAVVAR